MAPRLPPLVPVVVVVPAAAVEPAHAEEHRLPHGGHQAVHRDLILLIGLRRIHLHRTEAQDDDEQSLRNHSGHQQRNPTT